MASFTDFFSVAGAGISIYGNKRVWKVFFINNLIKLAVLCELQYVKYVGKKI